MTFGHVIKEARVELGLTQSEFAEAVYVSQQYITQIERYGVEPRFTQACEMLKVLQLDLEEVWERIRLPRDASSSE